MIRIPKYSRTFSPKNIFAYDYDDVKQWGAPYPYEKLGYFHPSGIKVGKEYQRRVKGIVATIVMMPPEKFLNLSTGGNWYKLDWGYDPNVVVKLKKAVLRGEKLPLPYLDKSRNRSNLWMIAGHEGRHRAIVAKELGLKMIPVVVIKDLN